MQFNNSQFGKLIEALVKNQFIQDQFFSNGSGPLPPGDSYWVETQSLNNMVTQSNENYMFVD